MLWCIGRGITQGVEILYIEGRAVVAWIVKSLRINIKIKLEYKLLYMGQLLLNDLAI